MATSSITRSFNRVNPLEALHGLQRIFRNRYYDADTGRFIQRDPIGLFTDRENFGNGYSFGGANWQNRLDPHGLQGGPLNAHQPRTPMPLKKAQDQLAEAWTNLANAVANAKDALARWSKDAKNRPKFTETNPVFAALHNAIGDIKRARYDYMLSLASEGVEGRNLILTFGKLMAEIQDHDKTTGKQEAALRARIEELMRDVGIPDENIQQAFEPGGMTLTEMEIVESGGVKGGGGKGEVHWAFKDIAGGFDTLEDIIKYYMSDHPAERQAARQRIEEAWGKQYKAFEEHAKKALADPKGSALAPEPGPDSKGPEGDVQAMPLEHDKDPLDSARARGMNASEVYEQVKTMNQAAPR